MTNRYHILTVVGARPQFIKAAAMSRAIQNSDSLNETIVHSGQHYDHDLSGGFFSELEIPQPKYNLDIGSKSHNQFMGEFILRFDNILTSEKPDMVIVFGDTNTTAAAAIATAKVNIPLAHVEAGLREWNKSVPEEVNKMITDSVSDLFFSPTQTGIDNLTAQGVIKNVHLTGDISLDLLHHNTRYIKLDPLLSRYGLTKTYAFMTCHRESNTNSRQNLAAILKGVSTYDGDVLFPVHPRTRNAISHFRLEELLTDNIKMIDPIGFWETQSLLKNASLAVTDSGGIIKEAYYHKTPGIIIDTQTEWIETITEGWNIIAGPNTALISELMNKHKGGPVHTQALGDGLCGKKIVTAILSYLNN